MPTLMKFVLGSDVLQFEDGASYPAARPIEKVQVSDRTSSGQLQTEDLGISLKTRRLVFIDMIEEDYIALRNWFDVISNGSENEFSFTDEKGFEGNVIILDKTFNFPENDFELYSGSLTLEYK